MFSVPMLSLVLHLALGDDQTLKVMFFGDTVVAGVHNKETEICPFRYEFLRRVAKMDQEVDVIGTNTDTEGTCQGPGEGLDVHNNGYQDAGMDELLDYITADLQYLHNPVDYIFSSLGTQDCLEWDEGKDLQILSQSIRRIMGRLLNLNEKAKIVHLPILLPTSAGTVAVECMEVVNQKLRDVYDDSQNNPRIRIVHLQNDHYGEESFFKIGDTPKPAVVAQPAVTPAVGTPVAPVPPVSVPNAPAPVTPTVPAALVPVPNAPAPVTPAVPAAPVPVSNAPSPATPAVPGTVPADGLPRRFEIPLMFLPSQKLAHEIAGVFIDAVDWGFRAQTLYPTPEVTKEPDYYGYDWCMSNYEEDVCFEYYYGYTWCLEKYKDDDNFEDDECYNYYYGDVEDWQPEDNYKWCLNFYDEEYCHFAYLGEEPDTWDWLSMGYNDCLKTNLPDVCFDQYYGYAWCLNGYDDSECYEYYYGGDEWEWNEETSYKWCVNFYSEDDCSERYVLSSSGTAGVNGNGDAVLVVIFLVAVFSGVGWVVWKKFNCCRSKKYSRLDPRDEGGEDGIGLL